MLNANSWDLGNILPTLSTLSIAGLLLVVLPCAIPEEFSCSRDYGRFCKNITQSAPEVNCTRRGNFRVPGDCNGYFKCRGAGQQPCLCVCQFKFMYFDYRVGTCQFLALLNAHTNCRNARSRFILYGLMNDSAATSPSINETTTSDPTDQQNLQKPNGKRQNIPPENTVDSDQKEGKPQGTGHWPAGFKEEQSMDQIPVSVTETDQHNNNYTDNQ